MDRITTLGFYLHENCEDCTADSALIRVDLKIRSPMVTMNQHDNQIRQSFRYVQSCVSFFLAKRYTTVTKLLNIQE